ncbi:MAG: PorV/PorQ family protein [Saprospiraceae bacterium]|nr:PorV/PorQ family protein [Lewinella sp.]
MIAIVQRTVLFCLLFVITLGLYAQKYSNEFLSIGVGAKAQALGGAVVAGVNDVTAGAWNPAGLAAIRQDQGLQLGAMHAEWFAGVGKFDFIGLSLPMRSDDRRIGLSLIRFGIDGIPNTLSLYEDDGTVNFDNVTEFSAADYAFIGTYARRVNKGTRQLLYGGNLKVVHRRIGPFANSWGFGADIGLQYHTGKWQFGVLAKDITTTFNAWSFSFTEDEKEVLALTNNEIPINSIEITRPQLILGGAYRLDFGKSGLRPELNLVITTDGKRNTLISADPFSIDPAFGLEYDYKGVVFLRGGLSQFQQELDLDGMEQMTMRPSLGVGLLISRLSIDYAFSDIGDQESRFSHIISLRLDIVPRE